MWFSALFNGTRTKSIVPEHGKGFSKMSSATVYQVRRNLSTITIFVSLGLFRHFETVTNIRTRIKFAQILENVVRCKYFEAGVHIKNPIKNSYHDGLGRTTQTLDHVVVVHILIWDKRKSQINEYNDNLSCESLCIRAEINTSTYRSCIWTNLEM